jgi:hypothetical protein
VPEKIKPVRGYSIRANDDQLLLDDAQRARDSEGVVVGNPWGYISDVNDWVLSMFGAEDKSEFLGKHVLQFLAKEEKDRAIANSLESIETEKGRTEVYVACLKNGAQLRIEVVTEFVENEDGEKVGFIDIIRPI